MATKSAVDKLTPEIDAPDTRPWYLPFLTQLAEFPNVTKACAYAGVSRAAAYKARDEDDRFREAWEDCVSASVDKLEEVAFQRAEAGSDTLTIFLLKAHRPDRYQERGRLEVTGPSGGPVEITPVPMDLARAKRIFEILTKVLPEGKSDEDEG